MNDVTRKELKIVVERAVRPIRASRALKRKMREELLAHLMSVFEEELERVGVEHAALNEVKRRFGDPRELSKELQGTVLSWDRCRSVLERLDLQPGESPLHLALKQILATLVLCAVVLLVTLPVIVARGRENQVGLTVHVLLAVGVGTIALWLPLNFLPHTLGRALYGSQSERSRWMALFYCLASLPAFPAFAFLTFFTASGDLAASLVHVRFACCFAPAAPVLFALMSKLMVEEERYQEEWASLEIEE
jgi:hypothetical protein